MLTFAYSGQRAMNNYSIESKNTMYLQYTLEINIKIFREIKVKGYKECSVYSFTIQSKRSFQSAETSLRCQTWAIEFPCLCVLTLDSGDCLYNEHNLLSVYVVCVWKVGFYLWEPCFSSALLPPRPPISLGVHGWSGGNEEKLLSMSLQSFRNGKYISTSIS